MRCWQNCVLYDRLLEIFVLKGLAHYCEILTHVFLMWRASVKKHDAVRDRTRICLHPNFLELLLQILNSLIRYLKVPPLLKLSTSRKRFALLLLVVAPTLQIEA